MVDRVIDFGNGKATMQYIGKPKNRLSLLEKTRLANDALLVTGIIGVLHKLNQTEVKFGANDALVSRRGIIFLENLLRGEQYLSQKKSNLIAKPETAETVSYLTEKGAQIDVKKEAEQTIILLKKIASMRKTGSISKLKIEQSIEFNRSLHSVLMDRLARDQEISDRTSFI